MKVTHVFSLAVAFGLTTAAVVPDISVKDYVNRERDTIMAREAEPVNVAREAWSERYKVKLARLQDVSFF